MKVIFLDNVNYQTFPLDDTAIEIDEQLLGRIGIDKQFVNGEIVDYIREKTKEEKIAEIQTRLDQLSQDIVQDMAGEVVPDIAERKAEFVELHNELRVLLGKEEREVK